MITVSPSFPFTRAARSVVMSIVGQFQARVAASRRRASVASAIDDRELRFVLGACDLADLERRLRQSECRAPDPLRCLPTSNCPDNPASTPTPLPCPA